MLTLKQVKDYLSIQHSSEDDFLYSLYQYSLSLIEGYCNRTFKEQEYTEVLQGNNRAYLKTDVAPLNSISELKIKGDVISPTDYKIKNRMVFYENLFPAEYNCVNGRLSAYDRKYNVEITYIAGYKYSEWTSIVNETDVPYEVQYVCLEVIRKMYKGSGVCSQIQTKTISSSSESIAKQYFKEEREELLGELKAILNRYK